MKNSIQQYINNLTWSSIEAIVFQMLLLLHQSILFKCITQELYGLTGIFFGIIYFCVKLLDGGLSKILITFYQSFSLSRRHCRSFFIQQATINALFFIVLFIFFLLTVYFFKNSLYNTLTADTPLFICALLLTIIETIKNILKRLLHLSFRFRFVALSEIAFIALYQILLWSYYYSTGQLNLYTILGFCLLISLFETIGLSIMTYYWYTSLSHNTTPEIADYPPYNTLKSRIYIYCHTLSKQFFSGNILIPLYAYSYGLEQAALLKLASYTTHSITTIIEKIIEPSTSVLFARSTNNPHEEKQALFLLTLNVSWHILICILIFTAINCTKIFSITTMTACVAPYLMIYFLIHYCENFFIALEKFYVSHNRSQFLLIGTLLSSIIAVIIFINCASPLVALIFFLISRIITFIILTYFLSSVWNIRSSIRIAPRYIITSLILSIACRIIL